MKSTAASFTAIALAALALSACDKQTGPAATAANASAVQAEQPGWRFKTLKDAMTDKERGIAMLTSTDGASLLVFKCDGGSTDNSIYAQISFPTYMGKSPSSAYDESRELQYRVDGAEAKHAPSYYDESYVLITAPDGLKRFASDLSSGKHLVVRAKTYKLDTVDAEFDVAGAADMIRRVAGACKVNSPI
ncbi:hypothetical protein WK56_00355 [Burkholderia ubonensis]|uniref:hypothetical protein n=1 Tax=Burkholderia ubonensis TaxID=101571 RepID=UPI0007588C82|nr:hypothetical protein [Burkholderia ubonensis]KVT73071.1 hypothetical protein WK56_00355 [Burkholderia ubonensis]